MNTGGTPTSVYNSAALATAANAASSALSGSPGALGQHAVTSSNSTPSDIAKASALSYHLDVDADGPVFKNVKVSPRRRKRIKSKFAKRASDEEEIDDASDIDEATREERPHNDSKMQRMLNVHIAKQAEIRART